jgi:uncharacterized membrane protein YdjX (TVP38/TMEM64 family)
MRATMKILLVSVLLALIGLALVFRDQSRVEALLEQIRALGPWGPLAFILLYGIAPLLFVPGFLLTLAEGALFGRVWGTRYSLVAATGGAYLAFFIARYLASDWVEQRTHGIAKRLKEGWNRRAGVRTHSASVGASMRVWTATSGHSALGWRLTDTTEALLQ